MRHPEWEARLACAFSQAGRRPFEYGVHDCACFANNCAAAVLGRSPWADLFGFTSAREGYHALECAGGYWRALDRHAPRIGFSEAMRGDLALVLSSEGREALAVVDGPQVKGPGLRGLVARPISQVLGFWGLR